MQNLIRLKTKSVYRLLLLLIINFIFRNTILFVLSLLYLFFDNNHLVILFVISFCIFSIYYDSNDFIKIGFIDEVNDKYILVNKILYKTKDYNSSFEVGDIVYGTSNSVNISEVDQKKNIRFYSNCSYRKLSRNSIKYSLFKRINKSDNSVLLKSIFYNQTDYDELSDFSSLSLNFCFYYIVILLFRKNKYFGLVLTLLYSILFGFQIKFYLIILKFICSFFDLDRFENIESIFLLILFINPHLIYNYSIVYSLFISFIMIYNDNKYNPIYIASLQSLLFGEVKIFNSLFYKAFIIEKLVIFVIAVISLVFNIPYITNIIFILNKIYSVINISLRGKIHLILLMIFIYLMNKIDNLSIYIKYCIFLLLLIFPINNLNTYVDYIDVGQGDSILISDSSCLKNVLIDTGSKYNYYKLKKELFSRGIYKIDYLVITHDDSDHNGNIDNLRKDFKIINIIDKPKDFNTKKIFFKSLDIESIDNDNDSSLVYIVNIDDYNLLFTGDISSKVENQIIYNNRIDDVDILKVSHHGSKTASSDYFIGMLKPSFAIISTSGQYNHPHKEVINTLNKYSVNTLITKDEGNIKFVFTKLIDYLITDNHRFVIITK